jgi:hypothetical protein
MRSIRRGRAYFVAALVVLALPACGNEAASPSPASDATPTATPTARSTVDPSQIPSGPATPAFLDRAHAVAKAVRAAGIPKSPEGIFLYSSRTPGLGFDTTEQKVAWGAGHVTIAPGVKPRSAGTTRIDFGDGSNLSADVLDPRSALTDAIGTPYDNCGHIHIPASKCAFTITGASLKTVEVDTSRGRATVPAWSFTAKGVSRPIIAVAISAAVLKPVVEPTAPPGLADPDRDLLPAGRLIRADGNTLTFDIGHGTCDADLRAHAVELEDMIIIGGTHSQPRDVCDGVGASTPATITLTEPLGTRAVIDVTRGTRLTLYPNLK